MDAFDKLGTVCLVLSCLIGAWMHYILHGSIMLAVLFTIAVIPILSMAGLNTLEFLTRPFSEKKVKGILSWLIVVVLSFIVYAIFFVLVRVAFVYLGIVHA